MHRLPGRAHQFSSGKFKFQCPLLTVLAATMCGGIHRVTEYPECVPWCGQRERVEAEYPCPPKQRGDLACPVAPWLRKAKITGWERKRGFCARHRYLDPLWREQQSHQQLQRSLELLRMEAEARVRGATSQRDIFNVVDWELEEQA